MFASPLHPPPTLHPPHALRATREAVRGPRVARTCFWLRAPFAALPRLAAWLVAAWTVAACARSPVESLVDRSVVHLEAALALMHEAKGDETQLAVATMQYRAEHHADLVALRKDGEALLAKMDGEARRKIETEARKRTAPIVARIEAAAEKFPKPRKALAFVRPLIVQASPKPRTDGKLPWLPDVPEPPAGFPEVPLRDPSPHAHAPEHHAEPAAPTPAVASPTAP